MHRRMTIGHSREKEKYFSIKKKKQNTKRQQGEGLRHSLSSVRYVNERCRTVNIIRIVVRLNSRAIHDDLLVERRSEKIMKSRKKKKSTTMSRGTATETTVRHNKVSPACLPFHVFTPLRRRERRNGFSIFSIARKLFIVVTKSGCNDIKRDFRVAGYL